MTPSKKERFFEKNYATELLRIAEGDLKTALVLENATGIRIENAFYLAEQVVEKVLKAVLVNQGIAVPLIHDLGALLAKIPQNIEPPHGYELNELNQYASIRRYEEGSFTPTQDELRSVLEKSTDMLEWANNIIKNIHNI